jgi:predicted nucleotidyltransferase
MRDTLRIRLEDLRQGHLKELFLILEEVFNELGIDFYVLGALARDTWFAREGLDSRTTRDIDYALYVFSGEQYEEALNKLVENHGFESLDDSPFRLQTPFGYTIDLIPFGEISIDEKVIPDERWERPVFVNGFEEIFKKGTVSVEVDEGQLNYNVATLSAIVLLKLIAFDDRPEHRPQDPGDIVDIIHSFFDIESGVIYEHHTDLFERDLELHEYASIVIGREIKDILEENQALRERVLHILSLNEGTQQRMAEAMAKGSTTLEQVERWFELIKEGIEE